MSYDRSDFVNHGETGIPWDAFVITLGIWSWMRPGEKQCTVREAAQAFDTTDAVIREAVEDHPWMFLYGPDDDPTKQIIEHDGE